MKYIRSKFSKITKSQVDDKLLMYNSITGEDSLICVEDQNTIDCVYDILSTGKKTCENEHIYELLVQKGHLVPKERDEQKFSEDLIVKEKYSPILRLTIMPTEDCNFRCGYCYEEHKPGVMSEEVQESIIKYVRRNIHQYAELRVSWFGGEPLEAKEIVYRLSKKLLHICKVANRRYSAGITTNGYGLDLNTFLALLECRIYDYQITIDGPAEIHDKLRKLKDGGGTYHTIMENLISIRKFCKKSYFTIALRTNFTNESISKLDDYVKNYISLFGNDKRFRMFPHNMGKWSEERFDSSLEEQLLDKEDWGSLYDRLINYKDELSLDINLNFLSSNGLCAAGYVFSYVIGVNGEIYKCTQDFEFEDNKIGMLERNGSMSIDQEIHRKWYFNLLNHKCESCFFLGACQARNCPKYIIQNHGVCNCSVEKNSIESVLDLLDRKNYTHIQLQRTVQAEKTEG